MWNIELRSPDIYMILVNGYIYRDMQLKSVQLPSTKSIEYMPTIPKMEQAPKVY